MPPVYQDERRGPSLIAAAAISAAQVDPRAPRPSSRTFHAVVDFAREFYFFETAPLGRLFDVFWPKAHSDGASGQPLEYWKPVSHSHEEGRADQFRRIEDPLEQMLVQKNLESLDHARRRLTAPLNGGGRCRRQRCFHRLRGQQVCRCDGVLYCQINADPGNRRHRMSGVAYA